MRHRLACRGDGRPCTGGPDGGPRRVTGFGGRCFACHARWLRSRAVADMRELRGLGPSERPPELTDPERAPGYEDPDGFVWDEPFDVDRFVDPSLDDEARAP